MKDLAPTIYRQRAVIEGIASDVIHAHQIKIYLSELSKVIAMKQLMEPITHRSHTYGEAGWIHWETSGAHFYAWETPVHFFSVDIYTCKPFEVEKAAAFTQDFFECTALTYKSF